MKNLLQSDDPCCICRTNTASTTVPIQAAFMGRQLQIFAMLCQNCEKREDRDEVLKAYSERIFGNSTIQ